VSAGLARRIAARGIRDARVLGAVALAPSEGPRRPAERILPVRFVPLVT